MRSEMAYIFSNKTIKHTTRVRIKGKDEEKSYGLSESVHTIFVNVLIINTT